MADAVARSADFVRPAPSRAKTLRWLVIVGALLALFLGGLYGFNRYREQAIASFFASNKPPPAQIAAVTATTETVPRFAAGIGSLAAVHQVTITPEIGGLATAILFEPGAVVKQVEPLRKLLETRDKLRDLLTKVDRSEDLESLLERVLQNTEELKKLSADLGSKDGGAAGEEVKS